MTNWVEGLTRELETRRARTTDGRLASSTVVEVVQRYFVAHELEVAEVDYVLGLRQRITLLEEKVADTQGWLASRADALDRVSYDMRQRAVQ